MTSTAVNRVVQEKMFNRQIFTPANVRNFYVKFHIIKIMFGGCLIAVKNKMELCAFQSAEKKLFTIQTVDHPRL